MSTPAPVTAAAWRIIAAVETLRDDLRAIDLDEAHTYTRYDVRARIEAYDGVIRLLRDEFGEEPAGTVAA